MGDGGSASYCWRSVGRKQAKGSFEFCGVLNPLICCEERTLDHFLRCWVVGPGLIVFESVTSILYPNVFVQKADKRYECRHISFKVDLIPHSLLQLE